MAIDPLVHVTNDVKSAYSRSERQDETLELNKFELVIRNSKGESKSFILDIGEDLLVGRNYQSDFFSDKVSREHCIIQINLLGEVEISDKSSNGTIVFNKKGINIDIKTIPGKKTKLLLSYFGYIMLPDNSMITIRGNEKGLIKLEEGEGNYHKDRDFWVYNGTEYINNERMNIKHPFGWKIHICSYEYKDYIRLCRVVLEFLKNKRKVIGHKIVQPEYFNEFQNDAYERGRVITIYPKDEAEFRMLATEINRLLLEKKLGLTIGDLQKNDSRFKNGAILSQKGGILEKIVRFNNNSNRVFYRNELYFNTDGKNNIVSVGYAEAKFGFNLGGVPDPFEKGV